MKALHDSETSFGIHFFRRFAIVLDIILYKKLHRLIGQKSIGLSGDLFFWDEGEESMINVGREGARV